MLLKERKNELLNLDFYSPPFEIESHCRRANIGVHIKVALSSKEPRNARLKVKLAKVNGFFLSSYLCCSKNPLMGCRAFLAPQAKPVVLGNFIGVNCVDKLALRNKNSRKTLVEVFGDDQSGLRAVLPADSVLVPWTDYSQWERKPHASHSNDVIKRPLYPSEEMKTQNGQGNLSALETEMPYEEEFIEKDIDILKDTSYSPKKTPTPPEKLRAYTPQVIVLFFVVWGGGGGDCVLSTNYLSSGRAQVDTPGVDNMFSNDVYGTENESNRLRCVREISNDDESLSNDDRGFLNLIANSQIDIDLSINPADGLEGFGMDEDNQYSQERAAMMQISRRNSIDIRRNLQSSPSVPPIDDLFSPVREE